MSGVRVKCLDRLENIMDLIKMLKVIANGQAEKIGLIIKNKGSRGRCSTLAKMGR